VARAVLNESFVAVNSDRASRSESRAACNFSSVGTVSGSSVTLKSTNLSEYLLTTTCSFPPGSDFVGGGEVAWLDVPKAARDAVPAARAVLAAPESRRLSLRR